MLSTVAHLMHRKLQGKGGWKSKNAVLADYGVKNSVNHAALNELIYAGLLRKEEHGYVMLGQISHDEMQQACQKPEAVKRALEFFTRVLVQPMLGSKVRELAEQQQVLLGSAAMYIGHGLSVHLGKDGDIWGLNRQLDDVRKERIRELYEQNPKMTVAAVADAIGASKSTVDRFKRELGLNKKPKAA